MAYFFGDGFDLYALPADAINGYWDSGNLSFNLLAGRFSGSRGIQGATANVFVAQLQKSSGANDAVHHLVVAINQSVAISGVNNYYWFTLSDGATAQCSIAFRGDGAILLTSGASNGTTLATYTGALTAINTWYTFEIEVVINNTTGSIAVRKNGNTSNDFSLGSLNTRGGTANNYANRLTLGTGNAGLSQIIDDLLWRSDASSVLWVGDIRCYTRMPNADTSAVWARSGATFQMQPYFGTTGATTLTLNQARYTPFVSQGGTIGSVLVNLLVGYTGNMKCAIYASTAGQPGAVLQSATGAITNPVLGANTFNFSPPVSIAKGTQFFVAICSDTSNVNGISTASTAPYSTAAFTGATTYASFPVANPSGLSSLAAHSVFPVVTPAANADMVSEPQEDAAASYLSSANIGDVDLYTITPITNTPATIVGVTTRGYFQKSDAGTRNVAVQLKSGSTTVESTSTPLNTTWGWISRTDLVDPATGAAWTATAVNNANIGAIVKA